MRTHDLHDESRAETLKEGMWKWAEQPVKRLCVLMCSMLEEVEERERECSDCSRVFSQTERERESPEVISDTDASVRKSVCG